MSMELAGAPTMHELSLLSLTQMMSMELAGAPGHAWIKFVVTDPAGARGLSLCLQTLLGISENASE